MTMVASGEISIGGSATSGGLNRSINIELGRSATTSSNLNEAALRTLAGVPSGAISLSNFYGKSNEFSFTLTGSNVNLRSAAIAAGWNQSSKLIATINAGVTIESTSAGTPAVTVSGSFPGGVTLVNNGTIRGRGGNGGNGGSGTVTALPGPYLSQTGFTGGGGATALSVSSPITVTNNGVLEGGGGGGGGGGGYSSQGARGSYFGLGGGGGGGGRTTSSNTPGGTGGFGNARSGGTGGTGTSAGFGGGATGFNYPTVVHGAGGSGAGYGSTGAAGGAAQGTFGLSNQSRSPGGPGGGAGSAVVGNSLITWPALGTRTGPVNP